VRDLAQLRLMRTDQIERLHFHEGSAGTRPRRCRSVLQRLFNHRLIERLDRRVGGIRAGSTGFIYRLSPKGRRLLGLLDGDARRSRLPEPRLVFQEHTLAVTELAVRLHVRARANDLELLRFEAEPTCWRQFTGLGGESITVRPDAFVIVAAGEYEHLSFIEVDLGTESRATIRRKAELYRRYAASGHEQTTFGIFPKVVFLANDVRRARSLTAALQQTPGRSALFTVGLLDHPVPLLAGGES
jgi:hypothetical protein